MATKKVKQATAQQMGGVGNTKRAPGRMTSGGGKAKKLKDQCR